MSAITLALAAALGLTSVMGSPLHERQLTHAAHNHVLTNTNVWSPDGLWIVFDRRSGNDFDNTHIEQVNTDTAEIQTLYQSKNGAHCGVVTYSPTDPKIVFIHGPENPSAGWTYSFSRRRGTLVDATQPGISRPLDAMNYAPPFTPGALRGGSHVHIFSPDGQWLSFTYEDEVLARLDLNANAPTHQKNLRNIAVSIPSGPVKVADSHPRNNHGDYFSLVIAQLTARPKPGSDEIQKAFEEGWIGKNGYIRPDGSRQKRALAFQGHVLTKSGNVISEIFIADIPDDPTRPTAHPLQGTPTTRLSPPLGVSQRRLTRTAGRKYPGVSETPRHWIRVSPDGSAIAFIMKDDHGIAQLWTISPNGGDPQQITQNAFDIASAFTWSPDGQLIAHAMNGAICITELSSGKTTPLTPHHPTGLHPSADACVFSPSGRQIAYTRPAVENNSFKQIFTISLPSPKE